MSNYFDEFVGRGLLYQTASGSPVQTVAVKTVAGKLWSLYVANVNAAARWVYVFDNASAASGNLVMAPISLAIGGFEPIPMMFPIAFKNGLFIASSSAGTGYVASASNDLHIVAQYY